MGSKYQGGRNYFPGGFGCIVTFVYPERMHTLHADSREDAFEQARRRWGDRWLGEPCVSTPQSVLNDITGITALRHGNDLRSSTPTPEQLRRRRWRREGR